MGYSRTVFSDFASTIFNQKYAHVKANGERESWEECSRRVASSVMSPVGDDGATETVFGHIASRRLMPAGRYLYCAGRPYHQTNNCFLFSAEDTRQGWGDLMRKVTEALMTGGGIGVVYSKVREQGALVGGMGGLASGPVSLMEMVNEVGRRIRQGGSRRSAIWAGLHWNHPDIHAFLGIKNWPRWLIEQKSLDFNTPAPMDGTNVSVILDDEFFRAYRDNRHGRHGLAQEVYWRTVRGMCKTGEPGFSVDINGHSGENLRNAPVAGKTKVHTTEGPVAVSSILDREVTVWTGKQWAKTTFVRTGVDVPTVRVSFGAHGEIVCDPDHPFILAAEWDKDPENTGTRVKAKDLKVGDSLATAVAGRGELLVTSISPGVNQDVYCCDVGVAEHSFAAEGVIISNCTEVTSRTDSDVCNLASLNMARFNTLDEFASAIDPAIGFLLSNTLYSDLPLKEMHRVRDVNRRLGLGLMGLHEWLLLRRKTYGEDGELAQWLAVYEEETQAAAKKWAKRLSLNVPIATRAVAPTGTISIVAETTSGIEPIFASAYKRRYLKGDVWHAQYVIDAAAKRVVDRGVPHELIEDAYDLSADVSRRLEFQAFVQKYVDQGISSTINLPEWGSDGNNESTVPRFGEVLMQYLPKLRGITAYPDGSRGGQPLNKVPYSEALGQEGVEFAETGNESSCAGGVCGA